VREGWEDDISLEPSRREGERVEKRRDKIGTHTVGKPSTLLPDNLPGRARARPARAPPSSLGCGEGGVEALVEMYVCT